MYRHCRVNEIESNRERKEEIRNLGYSIQVAAIIYFAVVVISASSAGRAAIDFGHF
jgi:hypothetical protein